MSALEMQGWLVADFEVAANGRYQLRCSPAHHVELDNDHRLLHGDVYNRRFAWSVVDLAQGRHTLYIRVRCKGSAQLSCVARQASEADSIQLYPTNSPSPDIVASALAGVPPLLAMHVLNTGTSWRQLSLRVARSELPGGGRPAWARTLWSEGYAAPKVYNAVNASWWVAPGQSLILSAEVALAVDPALANWAAQAPNDGDCLLVWMYVVEVVEVCTVCRVWLREESAKA